jgi:electron transfer flavoprotein alpha subunit
VSTQTPSPIGALDAVAVVVARDGRLPVGADQVVAEAGGAAVVVGTGSETGARTLAGAARVWWAETGAGLRPGSLAAHLAPLTEHVPLLLLPASPDGRDLAPRLAACLGRPLVARAVDARFRPSSGHHGGATVTRLDDRVLLTVDVDGPVVVTLVAGPPAAAAPSTEPVIEPLGDPRPGRTGASLRHHLDAEVTAILEPDPRTMDLADASRVLAGGAGLAAGADDGAAAEIFDLLVEVAAAMGGSAGATRVATDAGWIGYERQIGTTGVTIDPQLYLALGIAGAAQHVGGLGTPRHIVSVNTDASCPMTAMADLGLVTDARSLLVELGRRFGVDGPDRIPPEAGAATGRSSESDDASGSRRRA